MKPSQFLYSESIKDQKAQKANVTKSIGELKPLPKTANPPKDQNSSMIYSLVNLPFKEGQNDQVIFPPALISQHMRVDPKVVVGKNTEIARSLKKLKPLESLDATPEQVKPGTGKPGVVDQSLQGPKLQTYLKVLNELTNGLFKKTQSQLLFGSVEQKINKSTALCVLRIQQLKFFNEYNQKNDKIPALFSWEALYRKKSLMKTTPKEFDAAQQDLLDFLYPRNSYESVDIVLWKIKNNDEKYIGQFDISSQDYHNSKEVLDFKSKYISETFVEKEMFKSMKQTKSYIGNVRFQLISLADAKIPLNKHSGIPGSPRTEEEKERHRIIDAAMSGQEYKWHIDDQERLVLSKIDIISQETIAETTISVVQDECGELYIVFESKYTDPDTNGRSRPTSRQMKKQHFDATMNLLKELDKNGVFTEVQGNLRSLSRQGKLSRKAVEDALQTVGCTANQLLLTASGEFGDCLMDFLLNTDDLPGVLEAMQEIKLVGEEEQNLESFSTNIFQNIGQHLRKNSNMKSVVEFIKALEKKPEVGLLIYNYSYASENILSQTPPFLQNFDAHNYEHVMVLGKLNKMIGKFGINTKFTKALKQTHTEAKKEIYFEIPCFPKDLDLDDKADSLQLKQMGQNVMHEIVRRQKWNKSHTIFEKYPEWFFVADEQDHTPFCLMLEQAPFDVIRSLFAAYPEQLQTIFSKFHPNKNLYESRVPKKEKQEEEKKGEGENEQGEETKKEEKKEPSEDDIFEKRKENQETRRAWGYIKDQLEYKKNIIHSLLLNSNILSSADSSLNDLKDILRSIELLVNQSSGENFEIMKSQKLRAGDFTPLGLYLEIIRSKLKRKQDRVLREIGSTIMICQILTPNVDEDENNQGEEQPKSFFKWTPDNQLIISQIIAKFPESIFERLEEERFAKSIAWIPLIEELKTIRYINLPFRPLIKHKQQHKLFSLAQEMNDEIKGIAYNPADVETDDNKKLMYYFQIQVLMLLEIRNLRSQKLDQVATQLFSYLRDFTLSYPELLIAPMPTNITNSYYPFQHFYKGSPKTLFAMLNLVKYNLLLLDIPVQYLDKLNVQQLAEALSGCKDKEPLKDFFRLVLTKDKPEAQAQPPEEEGESDKYNKDLFQVIADPSIIFSQESEKYVSHLEKQQIEQLILTHKEKILPLLTRLEGTRFAQDAHNLILRSFQTRKSVGITQQQVAVWIRNDFSKIQHKWVNQYINHFRNTMSLPQIHTLIDLMIEKPNITYPNQAKIYPYLQAQGNNWASILELRKFAAAIKDNIQYVDLERTIKSVAVNGQYEKLELLLPYVKDSALIKGTIHFVSKIADLQIYNQQKYYEEGKSTRRAVSAGVAGAEEGGDGQAGDGNNNDAPTLAQDPQVESIKPSKPSSQQKSKEKTAYFSDYLIRCYDPSVYFFKTAVKDKKEKYKIEQIKFPEALDQIRTPLSLQDQLKEMSPAIQLELDDFLRNQFPKCNRINIRGYENSIEKDVLMFRYLKNWKSSSQRQNIRAIFTPYDSGAGQQSYKKILSQLFKQFQRYGIPMCDTVQEFDSTLKIFMTYGLLNMEQIIFQVASSKLTAIEKNNIFIQLLKIVLGPRRIKKEYKGYLDFYSQLSSHYQQKNGNTYLAQINRIIKSINVKLFDEEMKAHFLESIIGRIQDIITVCRPDMLNEQKALLFRLASEVLQRLDQIDIRQLYQEKLVEISKNIKTRQIKDKGLFALANKYYPERVEQALKPSYKDIITLFKKKKLDEALQTDIVTYFAKYNDFQCEEIITELFKLPYDKSYREELLGKFNKALFEGLITCRRHRTYNKLIHDILFKQLLKGKEDQLMSIISKLTASDVTQNAQPKLKAQDQDDNAPEIQGEDQKKEETNDDDSKEYTLHQVAAFFNFYEYFDTLHRLRIKVQFTEPCYGNRFRYSTNEQLVGIASQFEQQGLNYLNNCVKLIRYMRMNHYSFAKEPEHLEISVMLAFIKSGRNVNMSPCMNIVNEYLDMQEKQPPAWQMPLTKSVNKAFMAMKVNGVERGVKFCFPSNYVAGEQEDDITNDDIRKTSVKKPTFTIDQYVDNLGINNVPKLDVQMINDPEFQSILKLLLHPYKQQEYLVQKVDRFKDFQQISYKDESMFYYFVNFPTFWYEDKIPKDQLTNRYFYYDFELGIVLLRATLLLDPKMIDQVLEIYFLSLNEEFKQGENTEEDGEPKVDEVEKEESEYEEYEVEVTDDEADIEQNQQDQEQQDDQLQQNKAPDAADQDQGQPNIEIQSEPLDGAPLAGAPEARAPKAETPKKSAQQAPDAAPQQKVKKTKKVMQKRKKQKGVQQQQWVEPKQSLRLQIQSQCNTQMQFQIFLQLLLFASTNEDTFRLVQKYFIQYEVIRPLVAPVQIDAARKARLIKDGFKEPFNQQFIEQMETKAKELKPQQIEDIKHIQEVLAINDKTRHAEQSEVYQVLISGILSSKYQGFSHYINKLLNNAAFRLLSKYNKQVYSHSVEKDSKLQLEFRNYYSQVEKIQLTPDFIVKFFENSKQGQATQDKWLHILHLLNYCCEISSQINNFKTEIESTKEKLTSYQSTICEHYSDNRFVQNVFSFDLKYLFKFKVSNKFEPIIYEYKTELIEQDQEEKRHIFNFELTFNVQKSTSNETLFPTAQLSSKYVEEVMKSIDTIYYDNYMNSINDLCSYPQMKVAQISGSDNIDYIQLKAKLTKDNFREYLELHYQNNFFLDDTIKSLDTYNFLLEQSGEINQLKILTQLREAIIVGESNEFSQAAQINGRDWNLYSERIRPDIKLKYQDKLYPVPYSNYQPRQRNAQYKQSIQIDQSFPELYPLVNLQVYQYIPDVMTDEQFSQKFDSLATIQQACYDLNSYAQSLDEFISSSPSEEELYNLREVAPQVISWPIIRAKVKRDKGQTESFKFIHSQEAHPLYMIEYLYKNLQFQIESPLKFTFNVLSVTEMLLFKLTRIIQQSTGKKCKLQTAICMIDEWTLMKKILLKIGDLLQRNELDKFKFYYVEFNEVHQNAVFQLKSNKFEGLDAIFRFGQTQFFVHSNVLIIRLNLAVISENATSLLSFKNAKLKAYESSHLLFKEDKDIRGYMSQIVTLEDMLKQIFTKK